MVLGERQAAALTGLPVQRLQEARRAHPRHQLDTPPYVRLGRAVRYPLTDLLAWCEARGLTVSFTPKD